MANFILQTFNGVSQSSFCNLSINIVQAKGKYINVDIFKRWKGKGVEKFSDPTFVCSLRISDAQELVSGLQEALAFARAQQELNRMQC